MSTKILEITQSCKLCQETKNYRNIYRLMTNKIHFSEFLDLVSMDILGPLNISYHEPNHELSKFYLLVINDVKTRWCEVGILFDLKATSVIECFIKNWVKKVGTLNRLLTENGTQFQNSQLRSYCQKQHIEQTFTSPYHPSGNGITERQNYIITVVLRCNKNKRLNNLPTIITRRINVVTNRNLGISPFEARYGFSYFDPKRKINQRKIEQAFSRDKRNREKQIELVNKVRKQWNFSVGDSVIVRVQNPTKLDPRWFGPAKIIETNSSGQIIV